MKTIQKLSVELLMRREFKGWIVCGSALGAYR